MFDMRAYVASLAAVFLALGIGILLGTIITDKGTVSRQQNVLLESIESRVSSVSEDNKHLKKELEINQRFEKEILPHVVQGRLAERYVALVHSGSLKADILKKLENVINTASGKMTDITLAKDTFVYSPENVENFKKIMTSSIETDEKILIPQTFASAIAGADATSALSKLKEHNFISVGSGNVPFFSGVLIVFSEQQDAALVEKFYKPFVDSLKKFSIPIVLAQISDEKGAVVYQIQDSSYMTIDNIDTTPGQISMIYGLAGRKGSYGLQNKAQGLIPGIEAEAE